MAAESKNKIGKNKNKNKNKTDPS